MEEYRNETLNLLKEIIDDYKYFENNAVIYLTGSFARHTVKPFSDCDLNIVYIDDSGEKYKKYEELFYYMVCEIFGYPRKAVHSIVTAFNDEKNIKYVKSNMDKEDITIILNDKNLTIKYKIPYLSKKRFYLQYLNDKNYKTIFKNLKKIYDKCGIQEWSNNFLFLNNNELVSKCYEEYISYIIKKINASEIKKYYKQIIEDFNAENFDLSYIKNIKKFLQMNEYHFIYNSITLLQLMNFIKGKCNFYNSYSDIISSNKTSKNLKKIIMSFYEYNYKIINLNDIFKEYDLEYSIHTNRIINLTQYPLLSKEINCIIESMHDINDTILKILKEEVDYDKE